jgi:NitT/TauT family transport system permease protein
MRSMLLRYSPLLLLAMLWELAPRLGLVNPESLPPLSAVAHAWVGLLLSGDLVRNGLSSLGNLVAGLTLGVAVGVALGVLMAWYRPIEILVNPLIRVIYPIPRSALIPVMILWFGLGAASKIASVFLGCLLPVVLSAYNGARGVDKALVWSALSAGASRRAILWEVVMPAAMPEILAGIRNALALSFILLVASEFLIGQHGLGYLISFLGEGGVYDGMFAGVITVSAFGFFADRVYLLIMQRALQWR